MPKRKIREISDYDFNDTTSFIDKNNPLTLSDLDIELPKEPPTKVISLRLPTELLNKLQAYAVQRDVPYTSLIKLILAEKMEDNFS